MWRLSARIASRLILPSPMLSSSSANSINAKPSEGSGCLFLSPSTPAVQRDPSFRPAPTEAVERGPAGRF